MNAHTTGTNNLNISASTISSNGSYGLYANYVNSPSIVGNSFTDNSGYPIILEFGKIDLNAIHNNTVTGNINNGLYLQSSDLSGLLNTDAPYFLGYALVPAGKQLQAQAGATIQLFGNLSI